MSEVGWVGAALLVFGVVVGLVATQVPAPRKLVRTHQALVAHMVNRRLSWKAEWINVNKIKSLEWASRFDVLSSSYVIGSLWEFFPCRLHIVRTQ